jgi:hypothetical protein
MSSFLVIVSGVPAEDMPQMFGTQYQHVVQILAPDSADKALHMTVLPGRSRRDRLVANAHRPRGTTVIAFRQSDAIDDPLTALAREGGRRVLAQVLVAEADAFSGATADQLSFTLRATATRRSVSPLRNSAKSAAPI